MSEAGISDLSNREDSTSTRATAAEGNSPAAQPAVESRAVDRFEQRIAADLDPQTVSAEQLPRLKEADWFSLARKLRQHNRDLLKKVAELEQQLARAREALQGETARSQSFDALSCDRARELDAARDKIKSLYSELEASRHRDRGSEQTLRQLTAAREQIAALERECALLEQRCGEQSHHLESSEQRNRELAARLECQQHRTLQFKVALDRCLETGRPELSFLEPVAADAPEPIPTETESDSSSSEKHQPIQPWSFREAPLAEDPEDLPLWAEKTRSEVEISEVDSNEVTEPAADEPEPVPQLERVEETEPPSPPLLDLEDLEPLPLSAFEPIEWDLEPTENDSFDTVFEPQAIENEPARDREEKTPEKDLNPLSLGQPAEAISRPQSNFPAPLVYPHRRERKHTSLATIELPNFRH